MSADPNMGFLPGMMPHPSSAANVYNHVVSFQAAAAAEVSSSPLFSIGVDSPGGGGVVVGGTTTGLVFAGTPAGMGGTMAQGLVHSGSSGNLIMDHQLAGFKQDLPVADWTYQEQSTLEEGLVKYSNEPNITKYIKIAAELPDKTVRDVALRCRWMTKKENGKRRKPEEYYIGKKIKDRKDKVMDPSLMPNVPAAQLTSSPVYPFVTPSVDYSNQFSYEVIDAATRRLLDENIQLFNQIAVNLDTLKLEDNIALLCHTRNNISAILNSMRDMPGIMSRMPPLPVALHEDLANSILPGTSQQVMYGTSSSRQLKQEPRC